MKRYQYLCLTALFVFALLALPLRAEEQEEGEEVIKERVVPNENEYRTSHYTPLACTEYEQLDESGDL